MHRRIGAVVLVLGLLAGTVGPVQARPLKPGSCSFDGAFAQFHDTLGDDIVGDCETAPITGDRGVTSQETSEGTLTLDARTQRVMFQSDVQLWVDGPGGIGADVTVAGLSEHGIDREPVVAPAARVFELAALDPDDLGPDWTYGSVKRGAPLAAPRPACGQTIEEEDQSAGSVQTWLYDEQHRRGVVHLLQAAPRSPDEQMRPTMERFAASCDGWTEQSKRGTYVVHVKLEPFVDLGDESVLMRMVIEQQESGAQIGMHLGYVRYGGLISTVALRKGPDDADDDLRSALEWLAKRAHGRVQGAAWYLRP